MHLQIFYVIKAALSNMVATSSMWLFRTWKEVNLNCALCVKQELLPFLGQKILCCGGLSYAL